MGLPSAAPIGGYGIEGCRLYEPEVWWRGFSRFFQWREVVLGAMTAQWFTQHEHGGFPIERAALGSCDLSMLHIGGEWHWLVRQAGRDVAEGAARTAVDAQRAAEAVALELCCSKLRLSERGRIEAV